MDKRILVRVIAVRLCGESRQALLVNKYTQREKRRHSNVDAQIKFQAIDE